MGRESCSFYQPFVTFLLILLGFQGDYHHYHVRNTHNAALPLVMANIMITPVATFAASATRLVVGTRTTSIVHRHFMRAHSSMISSRFLSSSSSSLLAPYTSTPLPSTVSMDEIRLTLPDGMTLAGQRYTYTGSRSNTITSHEDEKDGDSTPSPPPTTTTTQRHNILALHGWLDNCRSFHYLAPHLVDRLDGTAELIALDLPGHGWSSHKSIDGPPNVLSEALYYVKEAVDALGWTHHQDSSSSSSSLSSSSSSSSKKFTLLGHSMGGGISMAYAGVYPEQIDKLVMLDVYGPLPGQADKTASVLKASIDARQKGIKSHRIYPSMERAVQARRMTAQKAPGNQRLSLEAATEMVSRAIEPVRMVKDVDEEDEKEPREGDGGGGAVQFRHDTRLVWPSLQYLMPEQVDHLARAVECPTCIVAGDDGWPFKEDAINTALKLLDPDVHQVLPGSHHLHADPESSEAVLDVVHGFLADENRKYVI